MRLSKKFFTGILAFLMVFSIVGLSSYDVASANVKESKKLELTTQKMQEKLLDPELIQTVNPYVNFEDGKFYLKKTEELKQKISEEELSVVKDSIAKANEVDVKNTMSVKHNQEEGDISLYATCSLNINWDYHWWGYSEKFNHCEAQEYAEQLDLISKGAAFSSIASYWFPPIGAVSGLSATYYGLLSSRVNANDNGNGVYVGITWAAVFNIKPL